MGELGEAKRLYRAIILDRPSGPETDIARDELERLESSESPMPPNLRSDYRPGYAEPGPQLVRIVDIDISFWSMVWLMFKAAFAVIPAAIAIGVVYFVLVAILAEIGYRFG
jgi:hypothetical protein